MIVSVICKGKFRVFDVHDRSSTVQIPTLPDVPPYDIDGGGVDEYSTFEVVNLLIQKKVYQTKSGYRYTFYIACAEHYTRKLIAQILWNNRKEIRRASQCQ